MKKFQVGLAAALMLSMISCSSEEPQTEKPVSHESKMITFNVIQQYAMTRAAITSLSLTDLWMFDYVGDELQQTIHQSSTDDEFGSISAAMNYGAHTLYFVASRGTTPTTDTSAKTITWAKPSDTYWATANITVAPSSSASQAVTLGRVATRLQITVTDEVPANAAVFTVTPSQWYYGINYITGAGVGLQANYPRPVNIPANYIGTSGELMISFFGFVPSSDWQTDITATLTASDESVLGHVTLEDVPLKRNITTSYSGGIFGTAKAFTLTADDTWGEDDVHTW